MIGMYSIAVGDYYLQFAAYSLSITRHNNPYLPITLFYSEIQANSYLLNKLTREYDVNVVYMGPVNTDRWSVNFLKWTVDLSHLGDVSHYLYLDIDAFIGGPMTVDDVIVACKKPVNVAVHPEAKKVLKKNAIWTCNEPAAYYIPHDLRMTYYNAGVVLTTPEGMEHLRQYLEEKRAIDEKTGWFGTSPYYDENYINRYAQVDHIEKVAPLPSCWDLFHQIRDPSQFHICHMVAYGTQLESPIEKLRYVRQKWRVNDPTFGSRFFPKDYFSAGWLMESPDKFMLLGLLSAIRPRKAVWVGIWKGKDLECLRRRHPSLELHVIDTDTEHLRPTAIREGWLHFYHGDSRDYLPEVLKEVKPDLVYIDGCHEYEVVNVDVENALSHAPQAIVMGHDINYSHVERTATEASIRHPTRKLYVVQNPVTYMFNSPWGGFFLFDSVERDFERL